MTLTEQGLALREEALAVPGAVMERLEITEEDAVALHAALVPLIGRSRAVLVARPGG